jgi:hypothetical protein
MQRTGTFTSLYLIIKQKVFPSSVSYCPLCLPKLQHMPPTSHKQRFVDAPSSVAPPGFLPQSTNALPLAPSSTALRLAPRRERPTDAYPAPPHAASLRSRNRSRPARSQSRDLTGIKALLPGVQPLDWAILLLVESWDDFVAGGIVGARPHHLLDAQALRASSCGGGPGTLCVCVRERATVASKSRRPGN